MSTRKNLFVFVVIGLLALALGTLYASESNVDWETFGKNLNGALKSDNQGVRLSAVQQVIQYGDKVDVKDGIFEIVEMYRTNKDVKVRQLALSAINSTQNKWAMDFLSRNLKFEKSEPLKKQIYYILNAYEPGSVIARSAGKNQVEFVVMAKN